MTSSVKATWSPRLHDALKAAGTRGDQAQTQGLTDIGEAFVLAYRSRVGGKVGAAVSYEVTGSAVEIGSSSPLAALLERGRRPGRRPPPVVLMKSMSVTAKVAQNRADRIAQSGTKGRQYFAKSASDVGRNDMPRIARQTAQRLAELKTEG